MFKPAKMIRVRLLIHKHYFEEAMSALQDIGVLQIETLPERASALLKTTEWENYKTVSALTQRFRSLESLLIPRPVGKKFVFVGMDELADRAASIKIDERVIAIRKEMDSIAASINDDNSRMALLGKLGGFVGNLAVLNTKNVVSFVAQSKTQKELGLLKDEVKLRLPSVIVITLANSVVFSMKRSDEKAFSTVAENRKVALEFIPEINGRIPENIATLQRELELLEGRNSALLAELNSISENYYSIVSAIKEQLEIETEKFEVANKLGTTTSIVAMEGWVPSSELGRLEKVLRDMTDNRFVLERIKTDEPAPTKMDNPHIFKLFEFFVRFYSLPKSDELDPTIIFAACFPIFFGFMVGDVGYGLVMLVGALWLLHRLDHPPKRSRIPKSISSFVTMIVSPSGLRILAKSIIPGAIIAIILGAIFSEYFGFQPYTPIFDAERGLSTLLVISGWIGVLMVEFGFFLGFLNKLHEGERRHAIAKIGWMLAGLGFVIFGLNVIHRADLGLGNMVAVASYVMLVVGIIAIFVFEGAQSMMELPSLISHMLSYTRLVGILLASVILASVIDLIFVKSWNHGLLLGIVGTVILIVGQLFNIAIAMFEPGIQGARLIYVEFFSKFYAGNGKQFKPFTAHRQHTLTKFKFE